MKSESSCLLQNPVTHSPHIVEITGTPELFFDILPDDWRENIEPLWDLCYAGTTRIVGIEAEGRIVGGGIVFSSMPPDTINKAAAATLFEKGLLYIGFLWISDTYRGRNLGSEWLNAVRELTNNTHFWLTVDEFHLVSFYKKNDFRLVEEWQSGNAIEWLMCDTAE